MKRYVRKSVHELKKNGIEKAVTARFCFGRGFSVSRRKTERFVLLMRLKKENNCLPSISIIIGE